MYHVSHVTCRLSRDKLAELISGWSVINTKLPKPGDPNIGALHAEKIGEVGLLFIYTIAFKASLLTCKKFLRN